jgi:hypothetical protein
VRPKVSRPAGLVREHDLFGKRLFHYILKAILPRTLPSEKKNNLLLEINRLGDRGKFFFIEILGSIL